MDFALTPELEELIDEQIHRGRLRTPAEVVREALLLLKERTAAKEAERLVERIQSLLNAQQLLGAQRTAAEAVERYPDHPWLQRANRTLNPRRVSTAPASGSDRKTEFEWLRSHSETYRGQWVALLGTELIAADPDFDVVLSQVQARALDGKPLVHHVD